MKIILVNKNVNVTEELRDIIDKKFDKLSKYFDDDITAQVLLSKEKHFEKIEATISVKGTLFRAESRGEDVHFGIDKVIDKLSSQISKYKGRLAKRHKGKVGIQFDAIPDYHVETKDETPVKRKKVETKVMSIADAIMSMELVGHDFYLFKDDESGNSAVVYKRESGGYGLLEMD